MSNPVMVPLFLQAGKARELTDKLIQSTQTCPFFGVPDILIAHDPDSYADAFTIYITGLYILYFDCGGGFIENYFSSNSGFGQHISRIKNLRIALTHMPTSASQGNALKSLKNYIHLDCSISGWDDYLTKMEEADWKKVVSGITDEADTLYNMLDSINVHSAPKIDINSYKNAVAKHAVNALTICYKSAKKNIDRKEIDGLQKKLTDYCYASKDYTSPDLEAIVKAVFSPESFIQNNSVEKLLSYFANRLYMFYDSNLVPSSSNLAKKCFCSN